MQITKRFRETIKAAEAEGLTFVGVFTGGRHQRLIFENRFGQQMAILASLGTSGEDPARKHNERSALRRFARGQTHGLYVLPERVTTSLLCS